MIVVVVWIGEERRERGRERGEQSVMWGKPVIWGLTIRSPELPETQPGFLAGLAGTPLHVGVGWRSCPPSERRKDTLCTSDPALKMPRSSPSMKTTLLQHGPRVIRSCATTCFITQKSGWVEQKCPDVCTGYPNKTKKKIKRNNATRQCPCKSMPPALAQPRTRRLTPMHA
jgi:hypothetical protein